MSASRHGIAGVAPVAGPEPDGTVVSVDGSSVIAASSGSLATGASYVAAVMSL
jgi:hypothetical protein